MSAAFPRSLTGKAGRRVATAVAAAEAQPHGTCAAAMAKRGDQNHV